MERCVLLTKLNKHCHNGEMRKNWQKMHIQACDNMIMNKSTSISLRLHVDREVRCDIASKMQDTDSF